MATPTKLSLREHSALPATPRHDLANGVVYDVRVLGTRSQNKRHYQESVQRAALKLLEGITVHLDHPAGKSNARSVETRFGKLSGLSVANGETRAAEFRFNPNHPYAKQFGWDVEHNPERLGFSINADGSGYRGADGTEHVESIDAVYSVDLVDNPATNLTLFEQTQPKREATVDEPLMDPAATVTPDAGMGGGDDVKSHLVNAVGAIATGLKDGTVTLADAKSQLTKLLAMIDGGTEASEDEYPDDVSPETEGKITESLSRLPSKAARWAAKKLAAVKLREQAAKRLTAAASKLPGHALTEAFKRQLTEAVSDDRAAELIADRAALIGTGKPKSANRDPIREQAGDDLDDDKVTKLAAELFAR